MQYGCRSLELGERTIGAREFAELEQAGPPSCVARERELGIARIAGRAHDLLVGRDPAFGIVRAEADEGRIVERLREGGGIAEPAGRNQRFVEECFRARAICVAELRRQTRQDPRAHDRLGCEPTAEGRLED